MSFLRISFLSTTMELYRSIHEMFYPSLLEYSTGSQRPLDILLRKTNTGLERLSSLGKKYGQEFLGVLLEYFHLLLLEAFYFKTLAP